MVFQNLLEHSCVCACGAVFVLQSTLIKYGLPLSRTAETNHKLLNLLALCCREEIFLLVVQNVFKEIFVPVV